jgi:hypothetical protein
VPDVAGVRRLLPVTIRSPEWQCCGTRGIRVRKALGKSQWRLIARCRTCGNKVIIFKRGVIIERRK